MKNLLFPTVLITVIAFSSCQPKVDKVEEVIIKKNPTEYSTGAVLWQQHSAEYEALCYQAYNIGERRIDEIVAEWSWESPRTSDRHSLLIVTSGLSATLSLVFLVRIPPCCWALRNKEAFC